MEQNFFLPMGPGSVDLPGLSTGIDTITVIRVSGETLSVDPQASSLEITDEHPQVDRMEGDWGAICEVFRQSSYYYLALGGVRLALGDTVSITYKNKPTLVTLKVIDIENGRARIDPPVISAC